MQMVSRKTPKIRHAELSYRLTHGLPSSLGGEQPAWGLAPGRLSCGLFGTSHLQSENQIKQLLRWVSGQPMHVLVYGFETTQVTLV